MLLKKKQHTVLPLPGVLRLVLYPSLGGELREIRQRPWTGLFLLLQLRFFNHSVTMVTSASTLFFKYFKILFLIPSILEDLIFGVNG